MSRSAQQSAQESSETGQSDPITATEQELTLDQMTRVMDVARTLRKERSIAERELNREETITLLRRKLREAADMAGDPVTDQQIESAISHYFDNLHEFDPPEPGAARVAAAFYVRRYQIAAWMLALAAAALVAWGGWFSGVIPGQRRTDLQARRVYSQVEEVSKSIAVVATDAGVVSGAEAARTEAATYLDRSDLPALEQLRDRLLQQEAVLKDEYRLVIANDSISGIDRFTRETGELSGYYLIVDAVDNNGTPVPMQVRNAETNKYEKHAKWAEQVPQEVYERVKKDKEDDGIVDVREFGTKRRGEEHLEVTLPGVGGGRLERGRQITSW